jgi:hypothetical protein
LLPTVLISSLSAHHQSILKLQRLVAAVVVEITEVVHLQVELVAEAVELQLLSFYHLYPPHMFSQSQQVQQQTELLVLRALAQICVQPAAEAVGLTQELALTVLQVEWVELLTMVIYSL